MAQTSDSPGVRFPPPFVYFIAIILGVVLNRRWPLPLPHDAAVTTFGLTSLVGWFVLMVASVGLFRRSRTSLVPIKPATTLVIAGPYRLTRNPMYVSLALLVVGTGLLLGTLWPLILLVPTLMIIQQWVIAPEERYLHRRFGADYERYTADVRRWL